MYFCPRKNGPVKKLAKKSKIAEQHLQDEDARGLASFDKNHNKCQKIKLLINIRKIYVQKKDCNKIGTLVSFSML
jgi:hypothetical protein